jgi:hypothetical protein
VRLVWWDPGEDLAQELIHQQRQCGRAARLRRHWIGAAAETAAEWGADALEGKEERALAGATT